MNAAIDILKRWMAIDKALGSLDGLHISSFAKQWELSERTIRRDLEAFQNLEDVELVHGLDDDGQRHVWHYAGFGWMFTCNVPPRARRE